MVINFNIQKAMYDYFISSNTIDTVNKTGIDNTSGIDITSGIDNTINTVNKTKIDNTINTVNKTVMNKTVNNNTGMNKIYLFKQSITDILLPEYGIQLISDIMM